MSRTECFEPSKPAFARLELPHPRGAVSGEVKCRVLCKRPTQAAHGQGKALAQKRHCSIPSMSPAASIREPC